MNDNLRSVLMGTAGLSAGAVVALLLTILRRPVDDDLAGPAVCSVVQPLHFGPLR
jgi:hypothetical protein